MTDLPPGHPSDPTSTTLEDEGATPDEASIAKAQAARAGEGESEAASSSSTSSKTSKSSS